MSDVPENPFLEELREIRSDAEAIVADMLGEIGRLYRAIGLKPRFFETYDREYPIIQKRVKDYRSLLDKMIARQQNMAKEEISKLINIIMEIIDEKEKEKSDKEKEVEGTREGEEALPQLQDEVRVLQSHIGVLRLLKEAFERLEGERVRWDTLSDELDDLKKHKEEQLPCLLKNILDRAEGKAKEEEPTGEWLPQWKLLLWTSREWLQEKKSSYKNKLKQLLWKWDIHDVPGIRLVFSSQWECFAMAHSFFMSDPCLSTLSEDQLNQQYRYPADEWILVEEDLKEPDFKHIDDAGVEFTGYYARHLVFLADPDKKRKVEFEALRDYLRIRLENDSSFLNEWRDVQGALQEAWKRFQEWRGGDQGTAPSGLGSGEIHKKEHERNRLHSRTIRRLLLEYPDGLLFSLESEGSKQELESVSHQKEIGCLKHLRDEFGKKHISLSENGIVSCEGTRWLITDNGKSYTIIEEDGKLRIYLNPDDRQERSKYLYSLMFCEVQIRTILQNAWAEEYRDKFYSEIGELRERAERGYRRDDLETVINLIRSSGDMVNVTDKELQDLEFRYEEMQRE